MVERYQHPTETDRSTPAVVGLRVGDAARGVTFAIIAAAAAWPLIGGFVYFFAFAR